MKQCVAFPLDVRIMGQRSTNHSLPALFFPKRRSAVVKEEFLFISAVFVVVVVVFIVRNFAGSVQYAATSLNVCLAPK